MEIFVPASSLLPVHIKHLRTKVSQELIKQVYNNAQQTALFPSALGLIQPRQHIDPVLERGGRQHWQHFIESKLSLKIPSL